MIFPCRPQVRPAPKFTTLATFYNKLFVASQNNVKCKISTQSKQYRCLCSKCQTHAYVRFHLNGFNQNSTKTLLQSKQQLYLTALGSPYWENCSFGLDSLVRLYFGQFSQYGPPSRPRSFSSALGSFTLYHL